jgi:membrane protease YdiL (CAAX protease family)
LAQPDPIQAVAGTFAIIAASAAVVFQIRTAMRVASDGGKVRTGELRMPDALVAIVLAGFFLAIFAKVVGGGKKPDMMNADAAIQSSVLFLIIAGGVAGFLKYRGVALRQFLGLQSISPLRAIAWAIGLVVAAVPVVGIANAITLVATHGQAEQQELVRLFRTVALKTDQAAMLKIFVAGAILAPVCEEFLFRGFFYPLGKRYIGAGPSAVICAIFFAAVHTNLAAFAGLAVLALCLTLAYERTGSLLVPIGMHALYNSASLGFIYLQAHGLIHTQ